MAKDDYFMMLFRMLVFLYKRLKKKETISWDEYLKPRTKDFPVDDEYFNYLIEHAAGDGLIENVEVFSYWGGKDYRITEQTRITPAGIEYLQNNSAMQRVAKTLSGAVDGIIDIAGLFV